MIGNIPHRQNVPPLAKPIADKFGALPQVVAVALAGSRTSGASIVVFKQVEYARLSQRLD